MFIALGAHAIKYFKTFTTKIKIIVNRADDKTISAKKYNYSNKNEKKKRSAKFYRMEEVFKGEIVKSRSPVFSYIFGWYMAKYNFIVYYPFRNRALSEIDLLKPKPSFFAMLSITSLCVAWICSILLVSLI